MNEENNKVFCSADYCRELSPEEIRKIMKEVRESDTLAGSRKTTR